MKGRPALVTCLLSGVALSFAFPEPSIAPLAWVAIAPFLVAARGSPRKGLALGLVFGIGFFGALLIWIKVVGWIAWFVLVLMEALYLGAFGAAWGLISRTERRWWWVVAGPALWVTFETLREAVPVVGFPWGQLAQSQGPVPWLLQISQIAGGKTVSFVLVAVNVMLAVAFVGGGARRWLWATGAVGLVAAMVPLSYAVPRLTGGSPEGHHESWRVAIVQGNASPGVRVEDERARVQRHLELTRGLSGEDLDLVIWPESSVGIDPYRDADVGNMVAEAARAVGAPMIVGANLDVGEDHYKVTTLLVDESGSITDIYQKTHLVPFGEYVPAREALDWIPMLSQIPRDAIAGSDPKNFRLPVDHPTYDIATVISFEGDFGHLVRDRVAQGARLITVATNTSTWERTWASAQHLAMSQVRAAENRVPVVHAALSGISASVDHEGTVELASPLYEADTLVFQVYPSAHVSVYARTGEWLPILCAVLSLLGLGAAWRRRSTVPA